jgi:hypothetical protein
MVGIFIMVAETNGLRPQLPSLPLASGLSVTMPVSMMELTVFFMILPF